MRTTTRSEKFLLGVLGFVALVVALVFIGSATLNRQQVLERQRQLLQADQIEAMAELQTQPLWVSRGAWLRDHQPRLGEESDVGAQLLAFAVKGARDHHLEIEEQNLGPVQHGPGGVRVGAEIKLKGGMESLCRWLADLQQPQNFYAVDFFSLKADSDEKSVICELHLSRFFHGKNS